MKAGATLIDHTTSSPQLAENIAEKAQARGVHSVDAPVSGGDIGARNGKLVIMMGAATDEEERSVRPLLEIYGADI